ncbi:MAG: DUF2064 domain-containing protein [Halanaeroarchaeum sp.]
MTVAVALVDPPREELVLPTVVEETPLTAADAVTLYEAMLADFFETITETNADVLVNYPTADQVPGEDADPEREIREIATGVLDAATVRDLRFEVQVGSSPSAQIGNAITHLLRDEGESSALFVDHRVPLLDRSIVDQAAITLRRSDTVIGPAADGEVYLAGFTDLIDFTDVLEDGPLETLVERSNDAGSPVDFVRRRDVVTDARTLGTIVSLLRARRNAGAKVPAHTVRAIDELGLRLEDGEIVFDRSNR